MTLLAVPLIAVIALVLALSIAIIFGIWLKTLSKNIESVKSENQINEFLIKEMQFTLEQQSELIQKLTLKLEQKYTEHDQVIKQLEHRIKTAQTKVNNVDEKLGSVIEQQPEDKLYSRAFKLASLGADIDEIMQECELPRAEAEMLMSVYSQKIRER